MVFSYLTGKSRVVSSTFLAIFFLPYEVSNDSNRKTWGPLNSRWVFFLRTGTSAEKKPTRGNEVFSGYFGSEFHKAK
jgi:hypothetical protein